MSKKPKSKTTHKPEATAKPEGSWEPKLASPSLRIAQTPEVYPWVVDRIPVAQEILRLLGKRATILRCSAKTMDGVDEASPSEDSTVQFIAGAPCGSKKAARLIGRIIGNIRPPSAVFSVVDLDGDRPWMDILSDRGAGVPLEDVQTDWIDNLVDPTYEELQEAMDFWTMPKDGDDQKPLLRRLRESRHFDMSLFSGGLTISITWQARLQRVFGEPGSSDPQEIFVSQMKKMYLAPVDEDGPTGIFTIGVSVDAKYLKGMLSGHDEQRIMNALLEFERVCKNTHIPNFTSSSVHHGSTSGALNLMSILADEVMGMQARKTSSIHQLVAKARLASAKRTEALEDLKIIAASQDSLLFGYETLVRMVLGIETDSAETIAESIEQP